VQQKRYTQFPLYCDILCSSFWSLTLQGIQTRVYKKFQDWPPEARTASGTALYQQVQYYRCFVSQSSEFYRHNPLCCFSTSVLYFCCFFRNDSVRKLLDTFLYLVVIKMRTIFNTVEFRELIFFLLDMSELYHCLNRNRLLLGY